MSAPERIWANGLGVCGEYAGFGGAEYVRADLCTPTDERVKRLVDAAKRAVTYLDSGFINCTRCCEEVSTKNTDAEHELRAALRDMGVE